MGSRNRRTMQETTTIRWQGVCKECQREQEDADSSFAYPDSWARKTLSRGGTRSNRCPKCRIKHSRDAALMAVPYIDVATIPIKRNRDKPTGLPTGPLGGLGPLPTEHTREEVAPVNLGKHDFGLKDEDICNLLRELEKKQVAVVIAGTGSGKSTYLPFRLLYPPNAEGRHLADRGQIIVTQPRRCAATDIAGFVASLADPKVDQLLGDTEGNTRRAAVEKLSRMGCLGTGAEIGYRVSHEAAFDANCRLVYVTNGSLLNWLRDGKLDQFGTIIIDEAHERSQNIDFILGYLRDVLPRYPHLRVIIVGATINGEFFVNFFGGAERVFKMEIEAKNAWGYGEPLWPMKDVEKLLRCERAKDWSKQGSDRTNLELLTRKYAGLRLPSDAWKNCSVALFDDGGRWSKWCDEMPALMARQIVSIVEGTNSGDILAFLPTRKVIESTRRELSDQLRELSARGSDQQRKVRETKIRPLLASESKQKQEAALRRDPRYRRIILSTNVAETSLTIDGITFVVDSGLILQPTWDVETARQGFPTVFHSQDGVRQRWGRVGRNAQAGYSLFIRKNYTRRWTFIHCPHPSARMRRRVYLKQLRAGLPIR